MASDVPGQGKVGDSIGVYVPRSSLKKWGKNPRKNTPQNVRDLADAMKRFGFGPPVIARSSEDPEVIAGHQRLAAAEIAGIDTIPVRWMPHLSVEEAHAMAVSDNAFAEKSRWDPTLLKDVVVDLRGLEVDIDGLGFTSAKMEKLTSKIGTVTPIVDIDTSTVQDEFFVSIRGPMPSQPEALEVLKKSLEAIPRVHVEIGIAKQT